MTSQIYAAPQCLTVGSAEVEQFTSLGYLVLPSLLPEGLLSRLLPEVDRWVDDGLRAVSIAACTDPDIYGSPPVLEFELPAHGALLVYPALLDVLAQLAGTDFVFHHLHSDRQEPTRPGKSWHHDYEQRPQSNRDHVMVHALHYLDGLDRQTASLVVLPGSHRQIAEKSAISHLGTAPLDGEVVICDLPPGSTVVLHSALFHARRAPAGGCGRPRYFVDASYCQTGVKWPPVKPYWRSMLSRARDCDLHDSRWPELFNERHFAEYVRPS